MVQGSAGSGKKIRNLSWAETWLENGYAENHVTQGSQNSNPAGICFPLWVNYVTWRECPAGNLRRAFQLQVKGTARKNKSRHEKPPLFSATGLKIPWLSPASGMNWFGFLASFRAWYERQWLYPKGEALLPVTFASLKSSCCVSTHTTDSKSTAVTLKHLLGRYWFFLLSISSPDSNKEVKNQGKYKNQSALLWIHTWDSPGLKCDVCLRISGAIIRPFSCCEM